MKQRLLILSDLWGLQEAEWIDKYTKYLSPYFDIKYYDSCDLGGIDLSEYDEKSLHQQFVRGGIERAVDALCTREQGAVSILAFSIGGTIAWKAGLRSLQVKNLYAVSATRLRYETQKPLVNIKLYFGEHDLYQPSGTWFEKMNIDHQIFENQGHQVYSKGHYIKQICLEYLKQYNYKTKII